MDINSNDSKYSDFQNIKRKFFSLRNGIISDTLRRSGSPFKIIFGLNLPQLKEIANSIGKDYELSLKLFNDRKTRESLLLAPMIFPLSCLNEDMAKKLFENATVSEEIDILCHSLLRHYDGAPILALNILKDEKIEGIDLYKGLRLALNLINKINPMELNTILSGVQIKAEKNSLTKALFNQIKFTLE